MKPINDRKPKHIWRRALSALCIGALCTGVLAAPSSVYADPPGWHKKHHGKPYKRGNPHWRHNHDRDRYVTYRDVYRSHSTTTYAFDKSTGGGLVGAILGAAVGTQIGKGNGRTAAIVGGGLLGFIIGSEVGRSMERADELHTQRILENGRTGQSVIWKNPNTNVSYNVTPTATYSSANGQPCREYTTWVFIGGYEEQAYGTACRMPDGTWKPVAGSSVGG